VSDGVSPSDVARCSGSPHFGDVEAQSDTRFASVSSVASVSFFVPLSAFVTTAPALPSCELARLCAVAAAFSRPGEGPLTAPALLNCARAKAAATVVSSFTATVVELTTARRCRRLDPGVVAST
jgi:hypothetical protein